MPDTLAEAGTEDYVLDSQEQLLTETFSDALSDALPLQRQITRTRNKLYLFSKRAFDISVAGSILLVTSPILAMIALGIKATSQGPVLFLQDRYGEDGNIFCIYKFRTMYSHLSDFNACRQTEKRDDRVTWIGRFLRSHSLDELPQLINVLLGNMSLVGPRPHATGMIIDGKELTTLDNWALRYAVKPGITGWAQVNGSRGGLFTVADAYERLEYDLEYIDKQSLWMDIRIVLRTAKVFLKDNRAH